MTNPSLILMSATEAPQVLPFNLIQLSATNDRRVGTLLVREVESMVELSVYVEADPCPNSPIWTFNGTIVSDGNNYSFNNPCDDLSAPSPFLYTLTVNSLTSETSGEYSANFSNLAGQNTLPKTYITIPGVCVYVCVGLGGTFLYNLPLFS